MSSGLLALLDDIAAIAKSAAASIDDVAVQAVDASGRAAGVVIDDAAVTPKYVVGLSPKRELPIVWKIAKGSLRNKFLVLLPALLLLGYLAPWLVVPLLAVGGVYLCFEGSEKLYHAISHSLGRHNEEPKQGVEVIDASQLEAVRVKGAIRTDFILSAEIMAIAFAPVADQPFMNQVAVLSVVGVLITASVYGFVALILKADDIGIYLTEKGKTASGRLLGATLVRIVAPLLQILSVVGTMAMLWVGGQIIIHAIPWLEHGLEHWTEVWHLTGFTSWLFQAVVGLVFGILIGSCVIGVLHLIGRFRERAGRSPK